MSTENMDPNAMVRALEKLLDYTASGIGAVAGPMLAPWRARREAESLRIAAEGEADSLRIIAAAQAEARDTLVSTASDVQGEIEIAETVRQRIQFQEEKRQRNIGSVVGQAAELLGDKEVPDQEPDHDWTARFSITSRTSRRRRCGYFGPKFSPAKLNSLEACLLGLLVFLGTWINLRPSFSRCCVRLASHYHWVVGAP